MTHIFSPRLAFSSSEQGGLWILLLEKAYAKLFGAYDKIESGLFGHAFRDLTGAPYKYLLREKGDESTDYYPGLLWDFLKTAFQKGDLVAVSREQNFSALQDSDANEDETLKLDSHHSYQVLDLREVTDNDDQPARIIKIKNPWSEGSHLKKK